MLAIHSVFPRWSSEQSIPTSAIGPNKAICWLISTTSRVLPDSQFTTGAAVSFTKSRLPFRRDLASSPPGENMNTADLPSSAVLLPRYVLRFTFYVSKLHHQIRIRHPNLIRLPAAHHFQLP